MDAAFFVYNWKLPAYSRAFLLTVVLGSFFAYNRAFLLTVRAFLLTIELLCLQWESVSKKRPSGLEAKKLNCTSKSSSCKYKSPPPGKILQIFLSYLRAAPVYPYPKNAPNSDHSLNCPSPETKLRPWSELFFSPINAEFGVVWVWVWALLRPWAWLRPAKTENTGLGVDERALLAWRSFFGSLEVRRVRLSISGLKSGTNPETPWNALRANSEFPGFVRLEIPKRWKIKQIASPD